MVPRDALVALFVDIATAGVLPDPDWRNFDDPDPFFDDPETDRAAQFLSRLL